MTRSLADRLRRLARSSSAVARTGPLARWEASDRRCRSAKAFLTGRSSRGKLLFIGSIHAEMAIPFHVTYAVAKAGVNQLCRCFAAEMLTHRINVNAINPGWIDTPGERAYIAEEQLLEAAKDLPWGRLGTPHEIATLATFLLGNDSDYMTGEVISIDGGLRIDQRSLTHGLED